MKIQLALVALAAVVAAEAVSFYEVVAEEWSTWKTLHQRNYSNTMEEKFRLKIFMENKAKIARHNSRAHRGEKSYFLKMNHFGDMLHHEFIGVMNGYNYQDRQEARAQDGESITYMPPANTKLPAKVDWREHGAVTPVKDQGQCGSCWAFSSTGSLEGQHFRKTGKLVSLSEQNLVDCSSRFGNHGCEGGFMDFAFKYVKANGGIDTEKSYPYQADEEQCQFNPKTVGADDKGFIDVESGDEVSLQYAVATVGPVSVAIDASNESFQFYSHGVYDEQDCHADELDHGVLVVGYGSEGDKDYWLVKNSWSEKWGLDGYIKMTRNEGNQCGIATAACYPLV